MPRPAAEPVVHVDDPRIRVTEWRFAPGAETGWHRHAHDYVVLPLDDGELLLEEPGGGERRAPLARHRAYAREAGVEHNVVNAGAAPLAFLETELVADLAAARLGLLERFCDAWNARNVDALMACMAAECRFLASAGPTAEGRLHEGRDAVRQGYEAVFARFPEAAWTEGEHAVFGSSGLSRWRFVGVDADGRRHDALGCDLFRFDGPLIAEKNSFRKQPG